MILVDTSVWIDHLRTGNSILIRLLDENVVLVHPFIIGELALGNLRRRQSVLDTLLLLPQVIVASHSETMAFIERNRLFARGVGYVDAHLLAAARLAADTKLWTRDRRLHVAAQKLTLAADL